MTLRRAQGLILITLLLGALLFVFASYRVVTAGGPDETSVARACARVAPDRADIRPGERVVIARSYRPPSAECRWFGGARATLVPADAISYAGLLLMAAAAFGALGIWLARSLRPRRTSG